MRALGAAQRRSSRRVIGVVASVAGVAILASACGTAPAPGAPASPTGLALTRAHHVPAADSRAGATAYARRLLAGLRLPPGARKLPWPPKPPAGLAPNTPRILSDLVDLKVLYRLTQPMSSVYSYLLAHRPAGTTADAYGADSMSGTVTSQFADFASVRLPDGIFSADVNAAIEARPGGGSLLRADAFVAWYPPRGTARRIDPAEYRAVTIRWQHGYSVTARTFTSRRAVARYSGLYNALHGAPDVETSCPGEFLGAGRNDYQVVFIPAGNRPRVVVDPTTCMFVDVSIGGKQVSALYPATGLLSAATQAVHHR
ncbi:MAG TPA: hypothetical protein VMB74_00225 [Streptosporangiaceae bacterium]|nr:hypothetical protein [Streptosporangiaceae bacterium]